MPATRLLLVLAVLASAACTRDRAGADPDVSQQAAASGVEAFLRFGTADVGATRAELRARLGEPDSSTQSATANLHDPAVTDTIVTLHYPGLAAEIYVASFDGRELLAGLVISDDRHLRPESPLRIGMAADEIERALGEPDSATDAVLHYACTTCGVGGSDGLELHLARGALRRIAVHYWID